MNILDTLKQTGLPIVEKLEAITSALNNHSNLVLEAEPGAGKTTLVPLAVLDCIAADKKIIILEPRRLAARNAAVRMSELLQQSVGTSIGYRIRNESKVSKQTRIEVVTEGILIRMLQSDPELAEVGLIIFDEFHERSLDADLGLAFSLEVQQTLRVDLKLLVMSATLDTDAISKLMDDAPIIKSEGRCFPVSIQYLPPKNNLDWLPSMMLAVNQCFEEVSDLSNEKTNDDILIFLPGVGEIKRAEQQLENHFKNQSRVAIFSLYGDLPFAEQRQVLKPVSGRRKIILSTNIAETSVTIEGVGYVIDSGLMRQSAFDPNVGFNRLKTLKISSASAAQRSGRAGRLSPGQCYRLWAESTSLRKHQQAEILRQDLAPFVLELAQWGMTSPAELCLIEQPNRGAFEQAQTLLKSLDALDNKNRIRPHGKLMLSLGVHPRIAHMLIKSIALGVSDYACLIAAMLEEKDLLAGKQTRDADFMARVNIIFNAQFNSAVKKRVLLQSKRLLKKIRSIKGYAAQQQKKAHQSKDKTAILLALVFPDRIAQLRGKGYRLANGSGAIAGTDFSILDDLIVVVELGGQGSTAKIFQAIGLSIIELEQYFSEHISERQYVAWQDKSHSVKAESQTKFGELILATKPIINPNAALVLQGLIEGVERQGINRLPWSKPLSQWRARVEMLYRLEPYKKSFPNLSEQALTDSLSSWLVPYLSGLTKLSQITEKILSEALKSHLSFLQQKQLDQLMPSSLKVASGSTVQLDYSNGIQPVLSVKLQEMFGEDKSPRIANGHLSVVLHLLSPARRPLQITEDLESFWADGYSEVKKQMRGKYPKHPWPDDPLKAVATRFTKKRQK